MHRIQEESVHGARPPPKDSAKTTSSRAWICEQQASAAPSAAVPPYFSSACLFRLFEQLKRRAARIPSLTTIIMLPTTALICTAVMYLDSLRPARKDAAFSPHTHPAPPDILLDVHACVGLRADSPLRPSLIRSFFHLAGEERAVVESPAQRERKHARVQEFVSSCHVLSFSATPTGGGQTCVGRYEALHSACCLHPSFRPVSPSVPFIHLSRTPKVLARPGTIE